MEKDFSNLGISVYTILTRDLISTIYFMDMIIAAALMFVSIFLILISFLIIRFTVVFTVMEDYKQIGVMKAIGLKNHEIRRIYSVKYLALSLVSGFLGLLISFPVSNLLKSNISDYILLKDNVFNVIVSAVSVLIMITITILFCNHSTGKIKKISAIDAIRQGNTGERFKNSKKLKLHSRKRMGTPLYLAFSDITSDFKKFIILMVTFILGTAIIIIPCNVVNTLGSDEIVKMLRGIKSDIYFNDSFFGGREEALDRMQELDMGW